MPRQLRANGNDSFINRLTRNILKFKRSMDKGTYFNFKYPHITVGTHYHTVMLGLLRMRNGKNKRDLMQNRERMIHGMGGRE